MRVQSPTPTRRRINRSHRRSLPPGGRSLCFQIRSLASDVMKRRWVVGSGMSLCGAKASKLEKTTLSTPHRTAGVTASGTRRRRMAIAATCEGLRAPPFFFLRAASFLGILPHMYNHMHLKILRDCALITEGSRTKRNLKQCSACSEYGVCTQLLHLLCLRCCSPFVVLVGAASGAVASVFSFFHSHECRGAARDRDVRVHDRARFLGDWRRSEQRVGGRCRRCSLQGSSTERQRFGMGMRGREISRPTSAAAPSRKSRCGRAKQVCCCCCARRPKPAWQPAWRCS